MINKKAIRLNPLTRSEKSRTLKEARLHSQIKGRPVKRAYYKGMAAGMRDIAEQYGKNPASLYKSFLLNSINGIVNVHDITGKIVYQARSVTEAKKKIDSFIASYAARSKERLLLSKKFAAKKNPMHTAGGHDSEYKGFYIDRFEVNGKIRFMVSDKNWQRIGYADTLDEAKKIIEKVLQKPLVNPPLTEIYARILEIIAQKGPKHLCDAACRRAGHIYRHKFTKRSGVYGLPNGDILIRENKS